METALLSRCSMKIFAITGELPEPMGTQKTWRYKKFLNESTVNFTRRFFASMISLAVNLVRHVERYYIITESGKRYKYGRKQTNHIERNKTILVIASKIANPVHKINRIFYRILILQKGKGYSLSNEISYQRVILKFC